MADNSDNSVTSVSMDLFINPDGLSASVAKITEKVDTQFQKAVQPIADRVEETLGNSLNSLNDTSINIDSSNAEKAISDIENRTDELKSKINEVISDTEKSERSKAASIAHLYRQQGMDQSQTMKEAWKHIERTVDSSTDRIKDDIKKVGKESQSTAPVMTDSFNNSFKKIRQGSQSTAQAITNSFNDSFQKIGVVIAAAFSVSKIISFGRKSVETAAEVNAANSQLAQTFGNMKDKAVSAMKSVAKESGIVETRLQGVGTSIYAFAKASGMDSVSALNMMQDALQVTADSAAYYDRSLEETAESLKSFLKGNYANDAALGISCTETTRNAAANKLYGKSFKDLSEAQKQLALLQMVKDANKLSGAMGQAAREADGWENVTGNLKESWKQLIAVLGQPVLKLASAAVKKLTQGIQQLTVYANYAVQSISKLFNWDLSGISDGFGGISDSVSGISDSADDGTDSINDTTKAAEKLKKAVAGFDQLNILSSKNEDDEDVSTGSAPADISLPDTSAAEKSADVIGKKLDVLKQKIQQLYDNSGLKKFTDNFQKQFNKINFKQIGKNFGSIFSNIQPIAKAAFSGTKKVADSNLSLLGTAVGGLARTAGNVIQTVSGGIDQWLDKDKEKIIGYINDTSDNLSQGTDNLTSFTETSFNILNKSIEDTRPETEKAIAGMLSGFTTFGGSVGVIISDAYRTATENLNQWAEENQELIKTTFDNIFSIVNDTFSFIGEIFLDVGNILLDWWNKDGQKMWDSICKVVGDLGTIFLKVFNQWIKPAWDGFIKILKSAWNDCIKPVLEKFMHTVSKLWNDIIYPVWNNVLKPIIDWIINQAAPYIQTAINNIYSVFQTVFTAIGGYISGVYDSFCGLIDFISGVFTGDWEKAWNGICDFFKGTWESIWSIIKGFINLIIDGINSLWSGIYYAVKGIVDSIGGVAGALGSLFGQNWHFSMPQYPPLIPKLAKGGLVKAPTLAMVGDNKGAAHDPEVVSPLSKLQNMINSRDPEIIRLLSKIISLLENQDDVYQNNIYLDSEKIDSRLAKVRRRKQRRQGGAVV